jgi:hypothetical protein
MTTLLEKEVLSSSDYHVVSKRDLFLSFSPDWVEV